MGNQETASLMMKSAGYEDITFTRVDEKIMIGRPGRMHRICPGHRPAGEIFREAGKELAEAKRPEIEKEMRTFFESQERDENGIWAPTSSWVNPPATRSDSRSSIRQAKEGQMGSEDDIMAALDATGELRSTRTTLIAS